MTAACSVIVVHLPRSAPLHFCSAEPWLFFHFSSQKRLRLCFPFRFPAHKPLLNEKRGVAKWDFLFSRHEVDDVAATLTFPETVPTIFGNAHAEMCLVGAAMNRASTAQTVAVSTFGKRFEDAIPFKNLNDGNPCFDFFEINPRSFCVGIKNYLLVVKG